MPHPRLAFHQWPAAVYAIGDVHGCIDQLRELEDAIARDGLDIEAPPLRSLAAARAKLAALPKAQMAFIADLPVYLSLPGWLFVHAGIRPGIPLAMQTDDDLVWI